MMFLRSKLQYLCMIGGMVLATWAGAAERGTASWVPANGMIDKCERFFLAHHGPKMQAQRYAHADVPDAPAFLMLLQDKNTYRFAAALRDQESFPADHPQYMQTKFAWRVAGKGAVLFTTVTLFTTDPAEIAAAIQAGADQTVVRSAVSFGQELETEIQDVRDIFVDLKDLYYRWQHHQRLAKVLEGIPLSLAIVAGGLIGLYYQEVTQVLPQILILAGASGLSLLSHQAHQKIGEKNGKILRGLLHDIGREQSAAQPMIFRNMIVVQNEAQRAMVEKFIVEELGLVRQSWFKEYDEVAAQPDLRQSSENQKSE